MAVPVATAKAEQRTTPIEVPSFGSVEAYKDVEIKAQVTGVLTEVHFTEGQMVKTGDLLLSIDPRQPQALLVAIAEGELSPAVGIGRSRERTGNCRR